MSAAATALFGFSVYHKEICGVFAHIEGWKERSDNAQLFEIVHEEGTTSESFHMFTRFFLIFKII